MSQINTDESILSEDTAEQDVTNNDVKLVPVTEAIRYRKRAQSAEKTIETLNEQLAKAKSEAKNTAEELDNIQNEQKLMRKLADAGAVDLEAAVLIAKVRTKGETKADLDGVVEQLKKEKQYLFANSDRAMAAKKTAGAKDRMVNSQTVLEKAAKKAATTGNRTDLQEYLKLRRNFI